MALLKPKFGPCPPFCNARIDSLFDDGASNAPGRFDTFSIIVKAVGDDSFGAIFVGGYLLRWEGLGLIDFINVVGPIWAAGASVSTGPLTYDATRWTYLANFDIL